MNYLDYFSDGYSFNRWWYQGVPEWGEKIKSILPQEAKRYFLEIGAYEGLSTVMTIENMLDDGDSIFVVDAWSGLSDEGEDLADVYQTYWSNIANAKRLFPEREVTTMRMRSDQAMFGLITAGYEFDFVYVDGSHETSQVATDVRLGWELLSKGGVMVCDDYEWQDESENNRPRDAIDRFIGISKDIQVLFQGQQIGIRKL